VGPLRGHKSCQQTCSSMGSSLHGSTGPARSLLQHWLPRHHRLLWAHPPALAWTNMGCRGTASLTMVFITGCRGTSALAPGTPPPPPSSLTLVFVEWFLSHILTPFSCCNLTLCIFFPLLKYVITEALPASLMGLALANSGSVLEPAGIGSIRHRGSF